MFISYLFYRIYFIIMEEIPFDFDDKIEINLINVLWYLDFLSRLN